MRLIDYDKAWAELVYAHEPYAADLIQMMPTIDPETIPLVRQLREELARVTVERDAAVERVQHYAGCWECDVREKGNCATPFYKDNCDNWAWRGPQKEATP